MDNMNGNSASNGIMMEDEIMDTPAVAQQQPTTQPGQFQNAAETNTLQSTPTDTFGGPAQETFGANTGAAKANWENNTSSNGAFQPSNAGQYADSGSVVMYDTVGSNILLGLIGAVIGAMIGAVIWIVIYQLGFLAGIAGAAIIGFSIKGYIILGKGLDLKGVIVCAVISIITIWFAHRLSWTVAFMSGLNRNDVHVGFVSTFKSLPSLIKITQLETSYYRDLFVGYALSAVAGIPMARKMIANT